MSSDWAAMAFKALVVALALLCLGAATSAAHNVQNSRVDCPSVREASKSLTGRSPPIVFRPGDVKNKYFLVESPPGRFASRDFTGELVYENGESVPLYDVYLHHWIMTEYGRAEDDVLTDKEFEQMVEREPGPSMYQPASTVGSSVDGKLGGKAPVLIQHWAKGAETRRLISRFPVPYGLEGGNPPAGYKSEWVLNVHGIDTRGAVDRMGCTECRCDLFTKNGESTAHSSLPENYLGGFYCCVDESRCTLKEGFVTENLERTIYLQYTWEYVSWDECVVPLVQGSIDVTDKGSGGTIEYDVPEGCNSENALLEECVDTQEAVKVFPAADIIHVASHLHASALNATLYGEDGRVICNSPPIYGSGSTAGNEEGYVVGILTCYPTLGSSSAKIGDGEVLRLEVKYSKVGGPHTGLMGIMFFWIAPVASVSDI